MIPLSLSPLQLREARKKKKMAARDPGGEKHSTSRASGSQDLARPFFSRRFLSRVPQRTKRKRDSQSRFFDGPHEPISGFRSCVA